MSIIEDITERGEADAETLRKPLALAMARSAAVQPGQPLSAADMDRIVADLFRCSEPAHTPDGQPTMTLLTNDEIGDRFAR